MVRRSSLDLRVVEQRGVEIGREVEFRPVAQREWQRGLEALRTGPWVSSMPLWRNISRLPARSWLNGRLRRSCRTDPLRLAEITGREPQSCAAFVREHRDAFLPVTASPS